ncbi:MAG: UbiA-like polyprenyltransferase [Gemmatimonadota bacterium]
MRARTSEGQTLAGTSRFVRYANFVKLPHTVFALPFAMMGVTLASWTAPVTPAVLAWIIIAFTSARFAAMGFNRIVDRDLDARNPRTSARELPAGVIGLREATMSVVLAGALFIFSAFQLNPLCGWLSPVALAWVLSYSYTKRFTRWSHVALGVGLSIAPVGGFLAVAGRWPEQAWMPLLLALAVASWVAGFDVFYALQDADFDRRHGLHSIPVAVGPRRAVTIARLLHLVTVLALLAVWGVSGGGPLFLAGIVVAAALLVWEHRLVDPDDLSRLDAAFFTMNGVISLTLFAFVLAERLLGRGGG